MECSKVCLGQSTVCEGKGVFASQDIEAGEIVEQGIMTPLVNVDGHENPHLFCWSDDKKVWATGSGYLPFYNHSIEKVNIWKEGDLINNILIFYATKKIRKGEELLGIYYSKKWRKCFKDF